VLLEKADRLIGKGRAGVLTGRLRRTHLPVSQIAQLRLERVGHPAGEHRARLLETPPD